MRVLKEASADARSEFANLRHNREILSYIQSCYKTATECLVRIPDNGDFRQVQGQAQVLEHILHLIDPESAKP